MKIGSNAASRTIGLGAPPYVIAEIGVNHDGSVERAVQLVDAAADAGADAVKLQMFKAEMLMSGASRLAAYQAEAGERDPLAMLKRLELPDAGFEAVAKRCRERGVHAIVTVFSVELVEQAERVRGGGGGWDAYKTASPDIIHKPLQEALQSTGKPLIVSTGAATIDEVSRAIGWLSAAHREGRLALLQCVSSYPTPRERAALGGIAAVQQVFDGPVGYSDHTADRFTGASAVTFGGSAATAASRGAQLRAAPRAPLAAPLLKGQPCAADRCSSSSPGSWGSSGGPRPRRARRSSVAAR